MDNWWANHLSGNSTKLRLIVHADKANYSHRSASCPILEGQNIHLSFNAPTPNTRRFGPDRFGCHSFGALPLVLAPPATGQFGQSNEHHEIHVVVPLES